MSFLQQRSLQSGQYADEMHRQGRCKAITVVTTRSDASLDSLPVRFRRRHEQQKIADCLTSLDELIAAQGRKVEALKAHKKGLMQQLFPREGETLPRLRFPEFRNALEWETPRSVISSKSPQPVEGGFRFITRLDARRKGNRSTKTRSLGRSIGTQRRVFDVVPCFAFRTP